MDVLRQTTAKAAIENMVTAIDRLADSFADDHRARTKIRPENTDTPDLRVRRDPANYSCNRGAVAVDVAAIPGFHLDLHARVDDVQVIHQGESWQGRMIYFYSGIDNRDSHSFAGPLLQSASRFFQA